MCNCQASGNNNNWGSPLLNSKHRHHLMLVFRLCEGCPTCHKDLLLWESSWNSTWKHQGVSRTTSGLEFQLCAYVLTSLSKVLFWLSKIITPCQNLNTYLDTFQTHLPDFLSSPKCLAKFFNTLLALWYLQTYVLYMLSRLSSYLLNSQKQKLNYFWKVLCTRPRKLKLVLYAMRRHGILYNFLRNYMDKICRKKWFQKRTRGSNYMFSLSIMVWMVGARRTLHSALQKESLQMWEIQLTL